MTSQIQDTVAYLDHEYNMVAVEGIELFEPQSHGLKLTPLGSWCWRGFAADYSLDGDRLVLVSVIVSGQASLSGRQLAVGDSTLGGEVVPSAHVLVKYGGGLKICCSIPITGCGRLLIAREPVRGGRRPNMGFAPPWSYQSVVEVELGSGTVTRS